MCGRYTLSRSTKEVMERFAVEQVALDLLPRYNIAPSQMVPAIVTADDTRQLEEFKWGLVPFWAKDLNKIEPDEKA